jgi:H+/Cl- antiporter ClcA
MTATTMWTRLSRRYGWDHNPLRRRSDLIAAWLLPAAIAVFLILGTVAVLMIGSWLRADNATAWQHARQYWQPVQGRLTETAPGPAQADNGANDWTVSVPARWTWDGRRYFGTVPAIAGSNADSAVTVWLNHKGHVQTPPLTATQVGSRVLETRAVILAVLALMLTFVTGAAYGAVDRRRVNGWETEWDVVEPQWNHQS